MEIWLTLKDDTFVQMPSPPLKVIIGQLVKCQSDRVRSIKEFIV